MAEFDAEFDAKLSELEERTELVEITLDVLRERLESISKRLDGFYVELEDGEL